MFMIALIDNFPQAFKTNSNIYMAYILIKLNQVTSIVLDYPKPALSHMGSTQSQAKLPEPGITSILQLKKTYISYQDQYANRSLPNSFLTHISSPYFPHHYLFLILTTT